MSVFILFLWKILLWVKYNLELVLFELKEVFGYVLNFSFKKEKR